ncbi:MAG: hypothetical protein LLG43_01855, partial [Deltaproteobacteria bacterium]|nr:hypothetical protein [Deltaproteobacteria bacterium]
QGKPDLVKIVISPDVRRDDNFDEAHKNHRVSPSTEKSPVVEDPVRRISCPFPIPAAYHKAGTCRPNAINSAGMYFCFAISPAG